MLHIPNLKVLQRAAPRLEKYQTFILQPNTRQSLGRALVSHMQESSAAGMWLLTPRDLKTAPRVIPRPDNRSCCPQLAFSPTLIEHDCSETRNYSVTVAYRPAYKPALWPEFCENESVGTVCVDQPVPDRSALSLSPSLPLSLSLSRVDWIQHSSVQLTSCYTWAGGWGVSVYS